MTKLRVLVLLALLVAAVPAAAQPPADQEPADQAPAAETPAAETPAEETPAAETPAAETPEAETPEAGPPTTCPGNPTSYTAVTLTLDRTGDTILVVPPIATVWLLPGPDQPHRVCWLALNLEADETLHIQRKPGQEDLFPQAERTIKLPRTFASSGNPAKAGSWKYSVWVTEAADPEKRLYFTDPEVIVDQGG